jgi:hypothetical protein
MVCSVKRLVTGPEKEKRDEIEERGDSDSRAATITWSGTTQSPSGAGNAAVAPSSSVGEGLNPQSAAADNELLSGSHATANGVSANRLDRRSRI